MITTLIHHHQRQASCFYLIRLFFRDFVYLDDKTIECGTTQTTSITNGLSNDRTSHQSAKRRSKKHDETKKKRQKQVDKDKTHTTSFDDPQDENSSDDDHQQASVRDHHSSNNDTPTFAGQRVVATTNEQPNYSNLLSMFQRLLASTSKIESQYLRPLLVAQERTETLIKCLFENQKKIQKVLRKQKVK